MLAQNTNLEKHYSAMCIWRNTYEETPTDNNAVEAYQNTSRNYDDIYVCTYIL